MAQVHLHRTQAVLLQSAVAVGRKVLLLELSEGYWLGSGDGSAWFRDLAVVEHEVLDGNAERNGEELLLDPHQEVVDLVGLVLRLVAADLAKLQGVAFALVDKENAKTVVSF